MDTAVARSRKADNTTETQQQGSLAQEAYERLEEMIVTLELKPGSLFSESELGKRTNIGRTPLREALQKLAAQRLVTVLPRRGMIISQIDVRDHLALLELLRVVDRLIAAKAARRATPEQRDALRRASREMKKAAQQGELPRYLRLDHECDEIIYSAARNPFAQDVATPLYSHSRRFWYCYRHGGDLIESASLHWKLMNAVADGDAEAASKASDALIDHMEQFTRAALDL